MCTLFVVVLFVYLISLNLGKTFNFRDELHNYCEADVSILRRAVLQFKRIFIKHAVIDPFEHSITIASACSRVFRRLFLEESTIGIIPENVIFILCAFDYAYMELVVVLGVPTCRNAIR